MTYSKSKVHFVCFSVIITLAARLSITSNDPYKNNQIRFLLMPKSVSKNLGLLDTALMLYDI